MINIVLVEGGIRMNFQNNFLNALQSDINLTKTIQIHDYLPNSHEVPDEIANNLFYVHAYANIVATYPYYFELSHFDSYCLIYTQSGAGTLLYDTRSYTLLPHTLCFIDCREKHRIEIKQSPWDYDVFYIKGEILPYLYRTFIDHYENTHFISPASNLESMIHHLYTQLNKKEEKHFLHAKLIIDILLELILEKNQLLDVEVNLPEYLVDIKKQFDTNYHNTFSLNELEQQYHISKYRICREFTEQYDISPIQYLNRKRMEAAKEALVNTDKRINEISCMVGFENTNHFIRLFKQLTGVTPLVYRKKPPV